MNTIKVVIGVGTDTFSAYSDDVPGIWGEGLSVAEA